MARAAFLGTPDSALPALAALNRVTEVGLVITRPDAPRGRSRRPRPSPVREAAGEAGIPVETPARSTEISACLQRHGLFDLAVVVAYGMLIRPDALALPERGFLNLHFSLLPRWRGAAPVARALLAGDERSGVSVMRLDPGLDTGPVISMWATRIGPKETAGELSGRLATGGAMLLSRVVPAWLEGTLVETRQPDRGVLMADKIGPEDRRLRFDEDPEMFARRVRAMSPRPGATATHEGSVFKVLAARPATGTAPPGELMVEDGRLLCGSGGGRVELVEVQPAGKPVMPAAAWVRGRHGDLGRLE